MKISLKVPSEEALKCKWGFNVNTISYNHVFIPFSVLISRRKTERTKEMYKRLKENGIVCVCVYVMCVFLYG